MQRLMSKKIFFCLIYLSSDQKSGPKLAQNWFITGLKGLKLSQAFEIAKTDLKMAETCYTFLCQES